MNLVKLQYWHSFKFSKERANNMEREKISFDADWKFHYGDIVSVRNRWGYGKSGSWMQGPESRAFDDGDWRELKLPHDFVSETKPQPYMEHEFDGDNAIPLMEDVNNMHTTAGSFEKNVGWYRKHFFLPKSDEGRKIYLIFDGIFRDSKAFLNDFLIGSERSGYRQIVYDITDVANYGGENVLSVRVDATGSEGWFYEGGGIYRHAWLLKTEENHIDDIYVHANLLDSDCHMATVSVQAFLALAKVPAGGEDSYLLEADFLDAEGKPVFAAQKKEVTSVQEEFHFLLNNAKLWDTEHPYLYRMIVRLIRRADGEKLDAYETTFGVRKIEFDAEKGFLLNGKQVKIKGVCCHQNHGGLGSAVPDEVFEYRIQKLKEMGANAYRCSHYPPTSALLDILDRNGMLVMNENRLFSSEKGDLEQLETLVKLSRNHPSVILYSIGNEEAQSQAIPQSPRIARTMVKTIRKLDPHTPVTMAMLMWDLKNKVPITDIHTFDGLAENLDVAGFNYHDERWAEWHGTHPRKPMICTEQGTFRSTRDCAVTDKEKCHLAITDRSADSYMAGVRQWRACLPDWMSGLFIWNGFDYYGEPSPFAWPAISSQFGAMDLCGYPKDFYYYYQAWWSNRPVLHVFPSWNGVAGEKKDLHVFSNCREVELFVNGKSLGAKQMEKDGYLCWEGIAFEPGKLEAVGRGSWLEEEQELASGVDRTDADGSKTHGGAGKELHEVLTTCGKPAVLKVTRDFCGDKVQIFALSVLDAAGQQVYDAENLISFSVKNGRILGTSNGDPSDHELLHGTKRRVFHGLAQVIVEGDASASLECVSEGLTVEVE